MKLTKAQAAFLHELSRAPSGEKTPYSMAYPRQPMVHRLEAAGAIEVVRRGCGHNLVTLAAHEAYRITEAGRSALSAMNRRRGKLHVDER